jgi:uncharacterized protein YjiS (DUF1127 family)
MHTTATTAPWSAEWTTGEPNALLQGLRRRWRERRAAAALHALDDATLKDLGLHRCEIPGIARARRAELERR